MLQPSRVWRPRNPPIDLVAELEHACALDPLTARLLAARGVTSAEEVDIFLTKRLAALLPPERLPDMTLAAQRLAKAIAEREPVLIHGDFDVDGSTATTVMLQFCAACSHQVQAWIPHRLDDGYGLSEASYEAVRSHGAKLMVTVDCGIADHGWAQRIERELGCDVIITDHHLCSGELPRCLAVVDPNRPDADYPDPVLAGVGLAWKLCWATAKVLCGSDKISQRLRTFLLDSLPLVAIGTVADCAPLTGENRILVHHGLANLASTRNTGLMALLSHIRVSGPLDAADVGWRLGPLLNASGRLASAMRNIELLTSEDPVQAGRLVAAIAQDNDERRRLTSLLTDDLAAEVEAHLEYAHRRTLVFAGEGWHPGVVGIVASRLVERYRKPACVIAIEAGVGKGSLRAPNDFHLGQALEACRACLLSGGGHAAAAGISIAAHQVSAFTEAFETFAARRCPGAPAPAGYDHDGQASLDQINSTFFAALTRLAPFGMANPEPTLLLDHVHFVTPPESFGRGGEHVRGAVSDGQGHLHQLIAWRGRHLLSDLGTPNRRFSLLVRPELHSWKGEAQPRLVYVDGRSED